MLNGGTGEGRENYPMGGAEVGKPCEGTEAVKDEGTKDVPVEEITDAENNGGDDEGDEEEDEEA